MRPEDYQRLLDAQGGRCAFANCDRREDDERFGRLNVDHCHETGLIRGLLCWPHNLLLGHSEDQATALVDALNYLARPPAPSVLDGMRTPGFDEATLNRDPEIDAIIRDRVKVLALSRAEG
jgi:hypothetical protein